MMQNIFFLSCPRNCDQGLIVVIVYYFQIHRTIFLYSCFLRVFFAHGPINWLECLPMVQETGVQSQVKSYQKLKKWYLMPPWLTLSIIRWGSRVKWSNPGKGVAPSPTPQCSSYWRRCFRVTLNYGRQHNIIISRVISSHMGPMYIETPSIYTFTEWTEIIGLSHGSHVYWDTMYIKIMVSSRNWILTKTSIHNVWYKTRNQACTFEVMNPFIGFLCSLNQWIIGFRSCQLLTTSLPRRANKA